jgi:hypothetical protein
MAAVASIYLRFYIEFGVGVGKLLPTPTPPKIPSDSNALVHRDKINFNLLSFIFFCNLIRGRFQ